MPLLMLKDVPRYECLLKAAEKYPTLNPSASEAFLHLLRTGDAVYAAEGAYLAAHDLSQGRFMVLMLLNRCAGQQSTPAELADEAGVTRATMTGLVDTLERDGLVSRKDDSEDRRTVLVQLTRSGRKLLDRMVPGYFASVTKMMQPLTNTERKQFVALLQKIQRALPASQTADEAQPAGAR
jgi:DNA-binding MarR family transcriptional regulator